MIKVYKRDKSYIFELFFAWTLLNGLACFFPAWLEPNLQLTHRCSLFPPKEKAAKVVPWHCRSGKLHRSMLNQQNSNANTLDAMKLHRNFLSFFQRIGAVGAVPVQMPSLRFQLPPGFFTSKSTIPVYSWRVVFHGGRSTIPDYPLKIFMDHDRNFFKSFGHDLLGRSLRWSRHW